MLISFAKTENRCHPGTSLRRAQGECTVTHAPSFISFVMSSLRASKRARHVMTIPAHLAVALGLTSCEVSEEELEGRLLLAGLTHNSDSFNSPLLELVTNAPQVFVDIVLPALGSLELRMLAGVNTKMRDVVVTNSGEAATTKKEILRVATFVRSVSILAWARENGCLWNARTFNAAAAGGHLEVLQWARANGCPWVEGTCGEAAKGGDLDVLQWAHSNGCPWNEWTCTNAANGGHLEVLLWARARERLPLERVDVHERGEWRAPRGAAVGARERMLMERGNVLGGGE